MIEDASSGIQAIQQLKSNLDYCQSVEAISPSTDKISRLAGVSTLIENGTCLFPNCAGFSWRDFESESLKFRASTFKD